MGDQIDLEELTGAAPKTTKPALPTRQTGSRPLGERLTRAADMARAGYSRRAILRETGFSAAQIEEILVRVGRKAKR